MTDQDKMREEFEAWLDSPASYPVKRINYADARYIWQASRAQADAEHKEEIAKYQRDFEISVRDHENCKGYADGLKQQLSEANALIAMQAGALRLVYLSDDNDWQTDEEKKIIKQAISASAESVAAWEAEKLLPLQRQVAMLRSELLHSGCHDEDCAQYSGNLKFECNCSFGSALSNTQATAEAYDREHAAKVLEDYAIGIERNLHNLVGIDLSAQLVISELNRKAAELRAANKKEGE